MALITDLPNELAIKIVEMVKSTSDALAFISTCSTFYTHREDVLYRHLLNVQGRAVYGLSSDIEVYDLIKGRDETVENTMPFWFGEVSRGVDPDGSSETSVNLYLGGFFFPPSEDTSEDQRAGWIIVDKNKLVIHNVTKVLHDDSTYRCLGGMVFKVVWEKFPKGKLIKNSGILLRQNFICGLCDGYRSLCPGCGGFSRMFPDLFTSCGWKMPCPVCVVGWTLLLKRSPFSMKTGTTMDAESCWQPSGKS